MSIASCQLDNLTLRDGYVLNTLLYRPASYHTHIFLVLGKNECIYKYQEFTDFLYKQNFSVTIYDHRGQGTNAKILDDDRCHIDSFNTYVEDLNEVINHYSSHHNNYICAISMGALITLNYLKSISEHSFKLQNKFKGVIFISPFIGLKQFIPFSLLYLLISLKILIEGKEKFVIPNDHYKPRIFGENANTQDLTRFLKYNEVHEKYPTTQMGGITNGWLKAALIAIKNLTTTNWNLFLPSLFVLAQNDNMVATKKSMNFITRHTHDTCKIDYLMLLNSLHDILIEKDEIRGIAIKRIIKFIEEQNSSK